MAARAVENTPRVEALRDVIGDYLIPLVLKHLGSSDTVLDKKAQDVLVQLLQRGFVSQFQAEVKICPSVLALTKMEGQVDILPSAVRVSVLFYFKCNLNVLYLLTDCFCMKDMGSEMLFVCVSLPCLSCGGITYYRGFPIVESDTAHQSWTF